MNITRGTLQPAVVLAKFVTFIGVFSLGLGIGLSLVLPPLCAAVGQIMGTLAFGLCILLSPLRLRYFYYPTARDKE